MFSVPGRKRVRNSSVIGCSGALFLVVVRWFCVFTNLCPGVREHLDTAKSCVQVNWYMRHIFFVFRRTRTPGHSFSVSLQLPNHVSVVHVGARFGRLICEHTHQNMLNIMQCFITSSALGILSHRRRCHLVQTDRSRLWHRSARFMRSAWHRPITLIHQNKHKQYTIYNKHTCILLHGVVPVLIQQRATHTYQNHT